MRFINIETKFGEKIAINAKMITSVQYKHDAVFIFTSGGGSFATQFTDISSAVDYIQRAPSMSLGRVA